MFRHKRLSLGHSHKKQKVVRMQIFQFVRTQFLLHRRDVVKVNNEDFCRINVTEFNECISLGCVVIFSIRYYYQVFCFFQLSWAVCRVSFTRFNSGITECMGTPVRGMCFVLDLSSLQVFCFQTVCRICPLIV